MENDDDGPPPDHPRRSGHRRWTERKVTPPNPPTPLERRFAAAVREESARVGPELLPSALARACARVLPWDAAGLGLMDGRIARVPLGASDEDAAAAERLQFTAGDGPCFRAFAQGRPVAVGEESWRTTWPLLAETHFQRTPFRAGLSVPLRVGATRIGVLDLYRRAPQPPTGDEIIEGQVLAAAVTADLLGLRGDTGPRDVGDAVALWSEGPAARRRRQVWIAVGMTTAALPLPAADALSLLRARAYAEDRALDDLADDVVSGRLDAGDLRESRSR